MHARSCHQREPKKSLLIERTKSTHQDFWRLISLVVPSTLSGHILPFLLLPIAIPHSRRARYSFRMRLFFFIHFRSVVAYSYPSLATGEPNIPSCHSWPDCTKLRWQTLLSILEVEMANTSRCQNDPSSVL
ncbi:unnamed protein product [Haemonchus placei]|uniref:Uncharacterized protein n=1 Tax=Haemonchus placei TaxID=6290 RepID=A0A0N4WZ34_HAEPC|nr:unnamed protein product [Haemonchus placei]